jgi:8-oxo-dGTP pyrophosphatase MutT (NUDIX family)
MADVPAVPAASVIVLRDGPLEVLMLRRHGTASFAPNAWVFPGGVVDASDERGSVLATMRVTAARELFEETGIWLGAPLAEAAEKRRALLAGEIPFGELLEETKATLDEHLVWTSHWITPLGAPKRFDTYFFLTAVGRDTDASLLGDELFDIRWITPAAALESLEMIFPTVKNLEAIRDYTSSRALIESRIGADIQAIQPILVDRKPVLP